MATIGSLFSGIGGLELGLERVTGARTVWNCEVDEFCRKVLAKHWPDATQYVDVRNVDGSAEPVDILCGGFPCQNLSVAGDRTGLAGEKSGLWHEYARIVRVLRPNFVFVENVPALRTLPGENGLGKVLGDLTEAGYDSEWDCVPASAVGAPHVRDRIFILAWRRDMSREDRRHMAEATKRLVEEITDEFPPPPGSKRWSAYLKQHPRARPGIPRSETEAPEMRERRKRLKALGNAVVPQAAARAWALLFDRGPGT